MARIRTQINRMAESQKERPLSPAARRLIDRWLAVLLPPDHDA